nr:N-acetylglucosamine-6-phosphate deacetylase [uncultured Sellimonas sp.]
MIIKNVKVYGEDYRFHQGDVIIEDGRFCETASSPEEVVDGGGAYAVPGLIDIHFHGCMGADICDNDPEAIRTIANYEASVGVTTICPATMTLPVPELKSILSTAASWKNESGAHLAGLNMEGPFISVAKKGAQDERNIIPCDASLFDEFQEAAGGLIKFIGVAPEMDLDRTLDFIQKVKDHVSVSLAHTNAPYADAKAAFDAGACHAVHLFNAMPAFTHREPGVVGAVFDSKHVFAELICDGVHIHPSMVRAAFAMMGAERICLISDSMRATGMPDGTYTLGGLDVNVSGKHATLAEGGALAGSVTNLADCMRTAVKEMEIPLEDAIRCATINPARALHLDHLYGSIAPGKIGNLVLLNPDLSLKQVIVNG